MRVSNTAPLPGAGRAQNGYGLRVQRWISGTCGNSTLTYIQVMENSQQNIWYRKEWGARAYNTILHIQLGLSVTPKAEL
jgi:hypothetical protein